MTAIRVSCKLFHPLYTGQGVVLSQLADSNRTLRKLCLHNKHNIQIQPGLKAKLSLIYSQFTLRKRKKKFNAKRRQQQERYKKKSIRLISKKTISHVQHTFCTFICRCFARLQLPSSRNFLVSTRFIEEMSYVFLSTFFHCRSFASFVISSPPDMKLFD